MKSSKGLDQKTVYHNLGKGVAFVQMIGHVIRNAGNAMDMSFKEVQNLILKEGISDTKLRARKMTEMFWKFQNKLPEEDLSFDDFFSCLTIGDTEEDQKTNLLKLDKNIRQNFFQKMVDIFSMPPQTNDNKMERKDNGSIETDKDFGYVSAEGQEGVLLFEVETKCEETISVSIFVDEKCGYSADISVESGAMRGVVRLKESKKFDRIFF